MTSRVTRRILIGLGIVVLLAVVAFGPRVVSDLTKKKAVGPGLATVARQSFPVVAKAAGSLTPQSLMFVNFASAGTIAQLNVKVGDAVTAGQLLAKLDQSAAQAEFQAAETSLSSARQALAAAGHNETAAAAAEAQIASAQVQIQRAQADLSHTTLTAPEAASVLAVNAQVGETVTAGSTRVPTLPGSFSIVDPNAATSSAPANVFIVLGSLTNFQVSAPFSQSDAAQLQVGQVGTVSFDAVPGLTMQAHIVAISNSATQVSGVNEYYAAIDTDGVDARLRSGMSASVSITVAQATNVLAVPNQSLFTLNNSPYVDIWFQGAAVATKVSTGLIGDQLTEITTGLTSGQQVVLSAGQSLPTSTPAAG
jgi:macrolide-specific efflux system membrane fusion protein